MPEAEAVAARARALAARPRDEWSDEAVVAELVGFSGGDARVLEDAWRRCARRDADATVRAAAALLHRAWARVNGFRETVLVPARPGSPRREPAPAPAAAPPAAAAPPLEAPRTGLLRRVGRRLRALLGRAEPAGR